MKTVQDHRESMRVLHSRHAFAVILATSWSCKAAAKAWHPRPFHCFSNTII